MAASGDQSQIPSKTNDGTDVDDELNDLLDSALEDFSTNPKEVGKSEIATAGTNPVTKADVKTTKPASSEGDSDPFTDQLADELAKEFEDAMKGFFTNDPTMMQQIEKLAEAAGNTDDSPEGQKSFGDTLQEALSGLAQNTEGLQDAGAAGFDEDMMKMFCGMGMENSTGGPQEDGFMPMMQTMMKTLLSRDVLYPSLKEISEKYPKWLSENQEKISESQYSNYTKQKDIITEILQEFDKETPSDTDDSKKQRFERIMGLMQRMQDLGQPPKEIVGDMAPGLEFDANGVPKFPGAAEACSIM